MATQQPGGRPARPPAMDEAEYRRVEEELADSLAMQRAMLDSLQGTTEDTPARRSGLTTEIRSIKGELKRLRANQRDSNQRSLSNMDPRGNHRSAVANPMGLAISKDPSLPSRISQGTNGLLPHGLHAPNAHSGDLGANTVSSVVNGPGSVRDRKRTYSSHLDAADPWLPDNKSRKTSPTLSGSNPDTPFSGRPDASDSTSTANLSEDEDGGESFLKQHRRVEEDLRRKKEQEEDDAWLARQFSDGYNLGLNHAYNSPLHLPDTARVQGQERVPAGPSAFDRIQARASQAPMRSNGEGVPGNQASAANPFSNALLNPGMVGGIPSHPKRSYELTPLTDFPERGNSSPFPPSSRMPGTYESEDNDIDSLFGVGAFDSSDPAGNETAADSDVEITGFRTLPGARPGTLVNGRTAVLSNSSGGAGRSLSDIINRTNAYDYTTGLDQQGDPIPAGHMNVYRSLQETQNSQPNGGRSNEDIQHLLANISTEEGDNGAETPEGFEFPLYLHQKIALKWMQNMESDDKKKGGILADDMGLGKTLSTLALIITRRGPIVPGSRYVNPTLIVAPVSLIKQWERETKTKIKPGQHELTVINAHDPVNKHKSYLQLRQFDIVLTTYDKLSREAAKFDDYSKKQASKKQPIDDEFVIRNFPFMGPRSMFHRVVLDEAQAVKNSKSQRFKAVKRLQALHRWCLTGTPMMNGVEELASLVSFLRIKPYDDPVTYKNTFGCLGNGQRQWGKEAAMKKLQALLKAIMLRRTKQSEINGQPIIQLQPKVEVVDHVIFGDDEDEYYQSLERDSQVKISKFLRDGLVGKHYTIALVLLLRLRQACCHPYLHITDLEFVNNDTPLKDMLANAGKLKKDAVQRIVGRIGEEIPFECPICYDSTETPSIILCGHHACIECLAKLRATAEAQNIQRGREGAKYPCPECRDEIDLNVYVTLEVFKQVHMKQSWEAEQAELKGNSSETDSDLTDDNDDDDTESDVSADDIDERGNLKGFVVDDDDDDEDGFGPVKKGRTTKSRKSKKSKRKGKKKEATLQPHDLQKLRKEAGRNPVARKRYMHYLRRIWMDSAKITKCVQILSEIQSSGEKTIIFSQWTLLLDLLELKISRDLKLGYRRYDGAMNSAQRDGAVTTFTNDPDCKVMLISLKAGNAGLNLTMASHVIIMDPFWNPFIEQQAVDRAHRIGQTKEVKVHRLLVQNTVEDRIITLQEKKRDLVNAALDEKVARELGRLSANDLAFLFGISGR